MNYWMALRLQWEALLVKKSLKLKIASWKLRVFRTMREEVIAGGEVKRGKVAMTCWRACVVRAN